VARRRQHRSRAWRVPGASGVSIARDTLPYLYHDTRMSCVFCQPRKCGTVFQHGGCRSASVIEIDRRDDIVTSCGPQVVANYDSCLPPALSRRCAAGFLRRFGRALKTAGVAMQHHQRCRMTPSGRQNNMPAGALGDWCDIFPGKAAVSPMCANAGISGGCEPGFCHQRPRALNSGQFIEEGTGLKRL
jgi:hypothetical protein